MSSEGYFPGSLKVGILWQTVNFKILFTPPFLESIAHLFEFYRQAGLDIEGSKFPDISVASKFFAAAIGKIPGLVDNVTDVYGMKSSSFHC